MVTVPAGGWTTGTIIELDHPTDRLVRLVPRRRPRRPPGRAALRRPAARSGRLHRAAPYSVASGPRRPAARAHGRVPCPAARCPFPARRRRGGRRLSSGARSAAGSLEGDVPAVCIAGARASSRSSPWPGSPGAWAQDLLRVVVVARVGSPYAAELESGTARSAALTRENLGERVAAPPYPEEVAPLVSGAGARLRLRLGRVRVTPPGCSRSPDCAATRSVSSSSGKPGERAPTADPRDPPCTRILA